MMDWREAYWKALNWVGGVITVGVGIYTIIKWAQEGSLFGVLLGLIITVSGAVGKLPSPYEYL